MRTLSAFQPPVGGEIEIMGKKLTDYTDKQLATVIGVVLTEKCSLRNMTVEELVGMGRSPYTGFWGNLSKEDKKTVNDAIALVRIEDLKYRMVHTLSDGERQKVMIAKALAQLRTAPKSTNSLFSETSIPNIVIPSFRNHPEYRRGPCLSASEHRPIRPPQSAQTIYGL